MTDVVDTNYGDFLYLKEHVGDAGDGFDPAFMPPMLFDFQEALIAWSLRRARSAVLADCGLGKTPIQLTWSQNIVEHVGGRVLVLTPLAVAAQTVREGAKFGVEARRARGGGSLPKHGVFVTNYEMLDHFDPADFVGAVCDESSILKSFDGVRRAQITRFLSKMRYRLLCTATSAPNDYVELGTHSEALGELGYMDMLGRFFVSDDGRGSAARWGWGEAVKFRLKGHAEMPFWRWVSSWARAARRPSDLGFEDGDFVLPPLLENTHVVDAGLMSVGSGQLFEVAAIGLREEREATRRSLRVRCERAAELVCANGTSIAWCNLNDEGDLLTKMIPDAVQVTGSDRDELKEERLLAFADGQIRRMVTKPRIGGFGLNFQRCSHVVVFPSHSFEQYYQEVRRCWRFGQRNPVIVDVVGTEGLSRVVANLRRKAVQAGEMFDRLVETMSSYGTIRDHRDLIAMEVPTWLR